MKSKISMFILAAILAVGLSVNMDTVFAEGNDYEEGSDESYSVQQKVEIEQDCDQKNVNDDSSEAALTNTQECTALGLNLNDIVIGAPEEPPENGIAEEPMEGQTSFPTTF